MMFTGLAGETTLPARPSLLLRRGISAILSVSAMIFAAPCGGAQEARTQAQAPSAPPGRSAPSGKALVADTPAEAKIPAQLELLETHYRFEADGSSRKEVHTIVKINSELGVRQFAQLNFDYNRGYESVEIPLVRITHSSGGTADVLPSAVTDKADPAVAATAAYQDVRVKSVRILGLEPSDTLEYRVITKVNKAPLAPNFWLEHSFDHTGVVKRELLEVDVPAVEQMQTRIASSTPADATEKTGTGATGRTVYRWNHAFRAEGAKDPAASSVEPDLVFTTFVSWPYLSEQIAGLMTPKGVVDGQVAAKSGELTRAMKTNEEKLEAIYEFVSQKIATVDLPLGATGYRTRAPAEILTSGVATAEDKFALFAAMAGVSQISVRALLAGAVTQPAVRLASPAPFGRLLICAEKVKQSLWFDPSIEVAPYGMIPAEFRGKPALQIDSWSAMGSPLADMTVNPWRTAPDGLPFQAAQSVNVEASLGADGKLTAKVKYRMRGDNELLLRLAFHQSPRDKWKNVAQILSLSDGFRGQITAVDASDPMATHDPFTVEYEISQANFVDWSKKPVKIPALLPVFALPDPPSVAGAPIELGTPLEVETRATLKLPAGFTAQLPTGTSVSRDYATFASNYEESGAGGAVTLSASRRIHFLARELVASRVFDYAAFLRAVQNDEAQSFAIVGPGAGKAATTERAAPAAPAKP